MVVVVVMETKSHSINLGVGNQETTIENSWVARDVTKNQTKKLSILLSFYFHVVLQYLNTFT